MRGKRNDSIELARILACFFVLCIHTYLPIRLEAGYDANRLLIACFVADAVAIFWQITGCFLFYNSIQNYKNLIKRNITKIVIPALVFSVFCFFFSEWIISPSVSLRESLSHTPEEYYKALKGFVTLKPSIDCTYHFWYIYTHLFIIFLFPAMKAFVDFLDTDKRYQKYYCIITLVLLIWNDVTSNELFEFSHHSINALIPASIFVIWGHIIYQYRERFQGKKYFFSSLAAYVVLNLIRFFIQLTRFDKNDSLLYWYSSIGLMSSIAIIIFFLSFNQMLSRGKKDKLIRSISAYTFEIYMIQFLMIGIFSRMNITTSIREILERHLNNAISDLGYMLTVSLFVFIAAYICLILLHFIYGLIPKCLKKCWPHRS